MAASPKTSNQIDQYIESQPAPVRPGLEKLRQAIRKAVPGAEEVLSYKIPAFKFHGMLLWFAAFKNHYGLYPYSKTIQVFKDKLTGYEFTKGTIKFPLNKPIPVKLVMEIVKFRVKESLDKEILRDMMKAKGAQKRK